MLLGCGPGNPLGRQPLSGRIALDGKPLDDGNIRFLPEQSSGISSGATISNGQYSLRTLQGLPPGKYKVQIFAADRTKDATPVASAGGFPPPQRERIPSRYNTQTTLILEVTASASAMGDFDLKSE